LSACPTGPIQKAYIVKFSIPVNFVVLIRVSYGSGSATLVKRHDMETLIRIRMEILHIRRGKVIFTNHPFI
jgi:hypothetical protein